MKRLAMGVLCILLVFATSPLNAQPFKHPYFKAGLTLIPLWEVKERFNLQKDGTVVSGYLRLGAKMGAWPLILELNLGTSSFTPPGSGETEGFSQGTSIKAISKQAWGELEVRRDLDQSKNRTDIKVKFPFAKQPKSSWGVELGGTTRDFETTEGEQRTAVEISRVLFSTLTYKRDISNKLTLNTSLGLSVTKIGVQNPKGYGTASISLDLKGMKVSIAHVNNVSLAGFPNFVVAMVGFNKTIK